MTSVLDLFSGIGGFTLGLERTGGFKTVAFCELDKTCRAVLREHWPDTPIIHDVRLVNEQSLPETDILVGGDPCPTRSLAKGGRKAIHPDLAGYFLAVVGRCRPRWVVRENVRASDVEHFLLALELLGYRTCLVRADAAGFTGQRRVRDFVIGCLGPGIAAFEQTLADDRNVGGHAKAIHAPPPRIYCLTAHPRRLAEDNYVMEPGRGIRSLSPEEREVLQGFPRGWTSGFSWSKRCEMIGRAVVPQVVEVIGKAILAEENP